MAVTPEKQREQNERLQALGLRKEDVVEQFIRASGPGGQKVNKTSSAVYLKHLPSGIEVKAQKDRSQAINRFLAWRLLADRLEALQSGEDKSWKKVERIRKQKKRRLRRTRGREMEDGKGRMEAKIGGGGHEYETGCHSGTGWVGADSKSLNSEETGRDSAHLLDNSDSFDVFGL
jgi:peptide chain release factor